VALYYRKIFERYGEYPKFVLTLRSSPERWFQSQVNDAMTGPCAKANGTPMATTGRLDGKNNIATFIASTMKVSDDFSRTKMPNIDCWKSVSRPTTAGPCCAIFLAYRCPNSPFPGQTCTMKKGIVAASG